MRLSDMELFVLDMDGTIYLGGELFPYTKPFLRLLREEGKRFLFFTNNSSRSRTSYLEKLRHMGIDVTEEELLTSGDLMARFLKDERPGQSVYLMGTEDLRRSFENSGIRLLPKTGGENPDTGECPDIALLAYDTELSYEGLLRLTSYVRRGAEYLATHPDFVCPTETGFAPDAGAYAAAVFSMTGKEPRFFGKPSGETAEMIERVTGIPRGKTAYIGDRLYTDVKIGVLHAGMGILVLSGETKREDAEKSETAPTMIFDHIGAIGDSLLSQRGETHGS